MSEACLKLAGSMAGAALAGDAGMKMGQAANERKPQIHDMAADDSSPIRRQDDAPSDTSLSVALQQHIPEEFEKYKERIRIMEEVHKENREVMAKAFQGIGEETAKMKNDIMAIFGS